MFLIKVEVGYIYDSNNYGKFKILKNNSCNLFTIEFIDTGFIKDVYYSAIVKGNVKDNFIPSVCNVGSLGYANKKDNSKYYCLWQRMLSRCYNKNNPKYRFYGEKGVTVCERWLRFDYFFEDVKIIDGFNEDKFINGELELDKDIKQFQFSSNSKQYSLETCCFVTQLNNIEYRVFSYQKPFIGISPTGEYHNHHNVREFCRLHNLNQSAVSRCLNGESNIHKGWKFKYIETNEK